MEKYIQTKAICLNKNGCDEYHFDYYDKENELVGTISVTEKGVLEWAIWNEDYANIILKKVSFIYGDEVENNTEYMAFGMLPVRERWDNAQEYIDKSGLVVNYKQDPRFNEEFHDGAKKRR